LPSAGDDYDVVSLTQWNAPLSLSTPQWGPIFTDVHFTTLCEATTTCPPQTAYCVTCLLECVLFVAGDNSANLISCCVLPTAAVFDIGSLFLSQCVVVGQDLAIGAFSVNAVNALVCQA